MEYFSFKGFQSNIFWTNLFLNLDRHLAGSAFRNIDILVGNFSIGSLGQIYANGYIFGKVKGYQVQQEIQPPIVSLEKTFQRILTMTNLHLFWICIQLADSSLPWWLWKSCLKSNKVWVEVRGQSAIDPSSLFNLLHSNISMQTLHTMLYTFLRCWYGEFV